MLDFTTVAKSALETDPTKTPLIVGNESISYADFDPMVQAHAACLAGPEGWVNDP